MSRRLVVNLWRRECSRRRRRRIRLLIPRICRARDLRLLLRERGRHLARSWSAGTTAASSIEFSSQFRSLVFRQSLFELCRRFKFWFLGTSCALRTWREIACCSASFCFALVEIGQHSLIVLLYNFFRYSFHAKDFDIKAGTIREGVLDGSEVFFMNLIHMHIETCRVNVVVL